jgi:hypothetical protein
MNDYRGHARAAGALLIAATVLGVGIANAIAGSSLRAPVDPSRIAADPMPVYLWALVNLAGYAACTGIALALYPVLRRYGEGLALGAVVFRALEAAFYALGLVTVLMLVSLGDGVATSGAEDTASFAATVALLAAARVWLGFVVGVVFFGLGALMYGWLLYRSALVPRWLAGWGIAGAVLTMASAALVLLGLTSPAAPLHLALNLPTFVQEMVLAGWLIVRGFSPRALGVADSMAAGSTVPVVVMS